MPNKIITNKWYKDTDINALLKFSLAQYSDVELLTAMLGTDWLARDNQDRLQRGNVLKANLAQFKPKNNISKVVIPVNLNHNHWVLIYIMYEAGQPVTAYYFDPKGNRTPMDVIKAVKSIYPHVEVLNMDSQLQAASDNDNCGVWIVEAAKSFVKQGALPTCDIQQARQEHHKVLNSIKTTQKSCDRLSQFGLFNKQQRKQVLNTITNNEVRTYIDKYLDDINEHIQTSGDVNELFAMKLQNEELAEYLDEKKVINSIANKIN